MVQRDTILQSLFPGDLTPHSSLPSSLVTQLRQLQLLIAQTSNKAAQTSTCVLVPLVYLCFPPLHYLLYLPIPDDLQGPALALPSVPS